MIKTLGGILRGTFFCTIGLLIGIAYLNQYLFTSPSTTYDLTIFEIWSMFGWVLAVVFLVTGIYEVSEP